MSFRLVMEHPNQQVLLMYIPDLLARSLAFMGEVGKVAFGNFYGHLEDS
jgi:hypothetical protein